MDQKQAIADKLKEANNILVTVSNNPSVDQLASCIGVALALNKMGKHATAVFSGQVPSTIEFLQPEKTLEKNTDSLRDFIIALDKSKADKLRYKVEDKVVKIFITPYKTSITDKDLNFSQGDFNVDVVLALGVHNQAELDQAITAHGRILHDATIATMNLKPGGEFGTMNWIEPRASSLCELGAELIDVFGKEILDTQMATAFLTGIVAETQRFSNERTSPMTMSISAELMAAGANQQLVATKLEPPKPQAPPPVQRQPLAELTPGAHPTPAGLAAQPIALKNQSVPKPEDGTLEISHDKLVLDADGNSKSAPGDQIATSDQESPEASMPQINIDDQGSLYNLHNMPADAQPMLPKPSPAATTDPTHHMESQHMILQPPSMGGQLSANNGSDFLPAEHDPISTQPTTNMPLLSRDPLAAPADTPSSGPSLPPLNPGPSSAASDLSGARGAVNQAIAGQPQLPTPIQALNAQPLGDPLRQAAPTGMPDATAPTTPMPTAPTGTPPPPVPPPMMPI